ncbi:hypothetical protein [Terribacillus saccharophilus]|uniref:hypothetical protein n=1 Tax=Terribacillus saccharophilus TaxID=361277 RepID=UPI002DD0E4D9|nr:hypothetical protein [Terribacillus saccharophilus]MEC0291873.1 hypothetical protein [Terribacillus saccharophilus]
MIVSYFSLSDQGVKLDKIGSSYLLNKVAEGKLDAMVNKVLSREEIPDRLNEVKDNHVREKVVVRMQPE